MKRLDAQFDGEQDGKQPATPKADNKATPKRKRGKKAGPADDTPTKKLKSEDEHAAGAEKGIEDGAGGEAAVAED